MRCTEYTQYTSMYNTYNTYLIYKRGFLRSIVIYLKDLSPYRRQFSPCSKSQNTIRVNLLGNYSTSYYYIVVLSYLYTQPNNRTHRSLSYKVPLHISLDTVIAVYIILIAKSLIISSSIKSLSLISSLIYLAAIKVIILYNTKLPIRLKAFLVILGNLSIDQLVPRIYWIFIFISSFSYSIL